MSSTMPHHWVGQHLRGQELPRAVRGEGVYVIDDQGKRYLDGSGGPALFCLGHGNREVIDAIKRQYDQIEFAYSTVFTSDVIDELSGMLVRLAGGQLQHVVYATSGSEAADTAMKVALQYQLAQGFCGRTHFIARRQSWHGYTFGALSLSGHVARRKPYAGSLLPVTHVSPANVYRPPVGFTGGDLGQFLANEFEAEILKIGPERVAAFFMEPVVGAAGGAVPPPPGYVQRMRDVCSRYGVLLVADEVMCGVGRCGHWRAMAAEGVEPDIMYTAKGLAGGYAPIAAVLLASSVYEAIAARFDRFASAHTYSGHTASCAAALAVQKIIERENLVQRCATQGEYIASRLKEVFGEHPHVGDIRGRGLFLAFEIVQDKTSKQPFPPELKLAEKFKATAFKNGLICYPSPGTADGVNGDHVLISPPYTISGEETDLMIEILRQTFQEVMQSV
jgi:adenosylmethionine-8-amino-7-oxononanoate aminotransferase